MIKEFTGVLKLDDDNNYIVESSSISKELHNNWMNEIPATYSLSVGNKEYWCEECVLVKRKYKGLYDYFAEDLNLDDILFNAVGSRIHLQIERKRNNGIHKS